MTVIDSVLEVTGFLAPGSISLDDWRNAQSSVAFAGLTERPPVEDSEDFRRIIKLPRRRQVNLEKGSVEAQALVEIMNERLRRPDWQRTDCKCASMGRKCIKSLTPSQAWALYEAPLVGGLIGHLACGSGKTSLNFLMAMVMPNCRQAVLLVPSNLVKQLIDEYRLWKEHWIVPRMMWGLHQGDMLAEVKERRPVVHVVPYSKLSMPTSTKLLKDLKPDLILADECQRLKRLTSTRTSRFVRVLADSEQPIRFCGWSGTVTSTGIADYAHLSAFALRKGSPLPISPNEVLSWSLAIDPSDRPSGAGVLRQLCLPTETLHQGFKRRVFETWGMLATKEDSVGMRLVMDERVPPPIPKDLQDKIDMVRNEQERPDGEQLLDALEVAACARQLACGFWYRWIFPGLPCMPGTSFLTEESIEKVKDWKAKRKAWRRELRDKLMTREDHLDSEALCTEAAKRAYQNPRYQGDLPVWYAKHWLSWALVENTIQHETETVWENDYLAADAVEWGKKHKGVIWYEWEAFGQRVNQLGGFPVHAGGPKAQERIKAEKGDRTILASIKSNGIGRDGLQLIYDKQLVANPPSSGEAWEQLLARLHRKGQESEEVYTWVYRHTTHMRRAIDRAVAQAKYVSETVGSSQKLLICDCTFEFSDGFGSDEEG